MVATNFAQKQENRVNDRERKWSSVIRWIAQFLAISNDEKLPVGIKKLPKSVQIWRFNKFLNPQIFSVELNLKVTKFC